MLPVLLLALVAAAQLVDRDDDVETDVVAHVEFVNDHPELLSADELSAVAQRLVVDDTPPIFATADDVELRLPTLDPVAVGFHEAAADYARPLTPVGRMIADRNPTRTGPFQQRGRPGFIVLSSRGRPYAATSSVDVAMHEGDPVLSPVDGVVLDVREYLLYGRYRDLRIEILPDARHDRRLVLLHVVDEHVHAGDRVEAGETRIAGGARSLPFVSHIDRDTGGMRVPHVHIELRTPDGPRPDPLP